MLNDERIGKATITRRDALKFAGVAGVMAALPWSGVPEANAAPPALRGPQSGGYYRFSIGDVEAVVISDGALSFQPIQPTVPRDRPRPDRERRRLQVAPRAVELDYGLIITILMLVISSQAKRTPSRPRPLILLPP